MLRLELVLAPHPTLELTAARLLLVALEELAAANVPVERAELGLHGRFASSSNER